MSQALIPLALIPSAPIRGEPPRPFPSPAGGAGEAPEPRDDRRAAAGAPYVEALVRRLAQAGETPVLRHAGRDVPAAAFLRSIFRYARALAAMGLGRGDLLALLAPNRPEALAIRYAAHLAGVATAYLSVPAAPGGMAALLDRVAPDLVVLFPETASLWPVEATTIPVSAGGDLPGIPLSLDRLALAQPDAPLASLASPGDLAVVISSGGSTGLPKGSRRDFAAYTAMVDVPVPAGRRQLINGRLAYLSQVLADTTLLGGGCVVLEEGFDPAGTLAAIEAERITDLFLVEPQLFELMDHPDLPGRDLASLRSLTHIGASAPPTLRQRARRRLGPVLAHAYGASEMGLVSLLAPAAHDLSRPELFACAGPILPGVELRFRREDGALALPGEPGRIEVRSPAMAGGYRHDPALEAAAFRDGWYRSGDLGRLDAGGNLHVLGRADDVARIEGRLVSPTEVQDTLCRLPAVRYAEVVADRAAGHWIAAIVPWPGLPAEPAACRAAVAARHGEAVAAALRVAPVDRLPLTEQGKPDRAAIRRIGLAVQEPTGAG
jgi:acyl-CoA synthetase (AMP-forming)/AMP-acid ligase II